MSPYGWSEAPLANPQYATGAPVSWWGRDVASAEVFYGALSGYGNWANHSRYGRVFLPGGVATGWQPYSQGYWRDDPRRGRMWVSSEPWGFATYHYGRWGATAGWAGSGCPTPALAPAGWIGNPAAATQAGRRSRPMADVYKRQTPALAGRCGAH